MFSSLRERVLTRTRVNKEVSLFFREKKTRGFLGEHKYIGFWGLYIIFTRILSMIGLQVFLDTFDPRASGVKE